MSRALDSWEYGGNTDFELGDRVSFLNEGERLVGKVVRVYASRLNYHVEVDGERYEVGVPDDDPQRV
jgi:hypothetical protein